MSITIPTFPFGAIRFDPDDSQPDYIGLNERYDAVTTATDWKIYKFTRSGSATTLIQLKYGAWDSRTGLF